MHSFATSLVFVAPLVPQALGAIITPHHAKVARWIGTPRSLQDPYRMKRENLDARGFGFSPLEKKDIFARQSDCSVTEIACDPHGCCPTGFNCYYYDDNTNDVACCPVGETCTGESTQPLLYFLLLTSGPSFNSRPSSRMCGPQCL